MREKLNYLAKRDLLHCLNRTIHIVSCIKKQIKSNSNQTQGLRSRRSRTLHYRQEYGHLITDR